MRKFGKYLLRSLLVVVTAIVWLLIVVLLSINIICKGPSVEARNLFVTTILETGQVKWLVKWFLPEDEINAIVNANSMALMEQDSDTSLITVGANDPSSETEQTEPIVVEKVAGDNYTGTMMIVKDPSRVFVGTTYPWGEYGRELHVIVGEQGAVAGINGGLYESSGNKGGRPYGPVVVRGEIQNMTGLAHAGLVLIGFNEDNILNVIDINGMGEEQVRQIIEQERIRDAVTFQEEATDANNHFVKLIINGERREMQGLGSGANPRTAIGQTADGRVLLFVTDGRGANGHLGATAADLIDVMERYGAVNAANLDGGSSTSMYYNGEYLQTSVTLYYANSSWNIPTSFLVSPEQ